MHGLFEGAVMVWGYCFAAALVIELIVNRRPMIVALGVIVASFAVLVILDWPMVTADGGTMMTLYGTIAVFGGVPALAGAGLARFSRLWISLRNETD